MRVQAGRLLLTISSAVLALGASAATGTAIQDLVHIKGHEHNVLTGLGIVIGLDTTGRQTRQATRLLDLLTALDQLKVPVEDQIAVIYELKKTGALHAQIVDK